jgi:hypothetical protein
MYIDYRDDVAFLLVYIREAHPEDGWQMSANLRDEVIFKQPTEFSQRTTVAKSCQEGLDLSMPMVIDGMDNAVEQAYSSWPDRLYVVGIDGRIAYKGGPGPGGFNPREMQATLERLLAERPRPAGLRIVPAHFPDHPSASVTVHLPWQTEGASNLMLPENLFLGQDVLFTGQNWVEVDAKYPQEQQPEVREIVPGRLVRYEHKLGDGYVLLARAQVEGGGVDLELTVENNTDAALADLRAQVCLALQGVEDFASKDLARVVVPVDGEMMPLTELGKVGAWDGLKRYVPVRGDQSRGDGLTEADVPLIGLLNGSASRTVGVSWQGARFLITNGELSCIHADPHFPECPPRQHVTAKGRIFFTEGDAQRLLEEHQEEVVALQMSAG